MTSQYLMPPQGPTDGQVPEIEVPIEIDPDATRDVTGEVTQDYPASTNSSIEPTFEPTPVRWAGLARQYLVWRQVDFLEEAIAEARKDSAVGIVDLLLLCKSHNFDAAAPIAYPLHDALLAAGRGEEAGTVALMYLGGAAYLLENAINPEDILRGVGFCEQAASIAHQMGDAACTGFFCYEAGFGYLRVGQAQQAEMACGTAVNIYRYLVTLNTEFEPKLAHALGNMGEALSRMQRYLEAEVLYREALVIVRPLAAQQTEFEEYRARLLNDLANALGELQELKAAEKIYREALKILRRLSKEQPERYVEFIAGVLIGLAGTLRQLWQLEKAARACRSSCAMLRSWATQQPKYEIILARSLYHLGWIYSELRQYEESEAAYREAVVIRRRLLAQHIVSKVDLAKALVGLGDSLRLLHQMAAAVQILREAEKIFRASLKQSPELELDLAFALTNLATSLSELQRTEQAIKAGNGSIKIFRRLAAHQPLVFERHLANALQSSGIILMGLWRLEQAVIAYQEAIEIYRRLVAKDPGVFEPALARTLINLGNAFRYSRQPEAAEDVCIEAVALFRSLSMRSNKIFASDQASALNALGNALSAWEWHEQAIGFHQEAVGILRRLAVQRPILFESQLAGALNDFGAALNRGWKLELASEMYRESVDLFTLLAQRDSNTYAIGLGIALSHLGFTLIGLRQFEGVGQVEWEALAVCERAVEVYRPLAERQPESHEPYLAQALDNLGYVLNILNKSEEAEQCLQEALAIYQRHGIRRETNTLAKLGKLFRSQKRWEEATIILYQAMKQLEQQRTEVLGLNRRMNMMRENIEIYEGLLMCLMELGRHQEAVEVAERGKSRTLMDILTLRDLRPHNTPPAVALEYKQILLRVRAMEDELRRSGHNTIIGEYQIGELHQMETHEEPDRRRQNFLQTYSRLRELKDFIRQYDPDFLLNADPLTTTDMLALAYDEDATLVLFRVTPAGSFVFLIFPNGETDAVEVPKFTLQTLNELLVEFENGEVVDGWVVRYEDYQILAQQEHSNVATAYAAWLQKMEQTLKFLYDHLIQPVHDRLKKAQHCSAQHHLPHLVLVPNRGLAILPLHACWWEEQGTRRYLMDDFVIRYAPSLSVFKRCLERERAAHRDNRLLCVANPLPPGNLIGSEWECEEVKRLCGVVNGSVSAHVNDQDQCLILRREQATEDAVRQWMGQSHMLHFSCHGQYRLDAPLESPLFLANGDTLTLGEIFENVYLPEAWLVVLAACETALVDFREVADEHYGFPVGFLYAGAPTVYGSLWRIGDGSSALLMAEAYRLMFEEDYRKAEALCAAQRWLRDQTVEQLLQLLDKKLASHQPSASLEATSRLRRSLRYSGLNAGDRPFAHPYHWAAFQSVGA